MKEIALRFSGGKDSTLAALRVSKEYDRVHLLTFWQEMINEVEKSKSNVDKLRESGGEAERFVHQIIDISPLLEKLYYGKGYLHDLKRYGTLARVALCTACDFSMFVRTIKYCLDNGITHAGGGGNKGEFAGFLDEWGLPVIRQFAKQHGIEWTFPVYDTARCDIELFEEGLNAKKPTLFSRSQATCRGGGLFANIHLRCYFLPLYGADKYKELTLAWLRERTEMASEYLSANRKDPCSDAL